MTPLERAWNEFLVLFGQITTLTMLLPVVVALVVRKQWNKPLKIFFWYCLASFGLNVIEISLNWAVNNYFDFFKPALDYWEIEYFFFFTIFYYLKDFILLGLFYSLIFPIASIGSIILRISQVLALAALINYLFIEGYNVFGIFNPLADAIFLVVLPLLYLWVSQRQSLRIPLRKNPYFWFSLGILLPNILALFIYFTGDYIHTTDFILYAKIYSVKNALEIVGQILICIGFLRSRYTKFITIAEQTPPSIGS